MNNILESGLCGFISYSHDDVKEIIELKKELDEFVVNHSLSIWYDRMIDVGSKWEPQIELQLKNADIVIFCITSSFLKSKSCRDYIL